MWQLLGKICHYRYIKALPWRNSVLLLPK